jgi:hypothetical protein
MESILLGGLALVGLNSSKEQKPTKNNIKKNKLDDKYYSNVSDKMNNLERTQANNLKKSIVEKKPLYFSQFDELRFDTVSDPVATSDSHITIIGANKTLQRGLDLVNGYSGINDELNYGIVSGENFTHNNMAPHTRRREYTVDNDRSSRKLESFSGVSEFYVPKQEKYHLFEPMKNLTYVNGMPVFTDYLDDRYLASSKNNNGNLPFENNVFVRPGIDGEVREGLGAVYRVNPRTTDALRGDNNPKISYLNKPLETIKKGEFRAPDYNITKVKIPDFRVQNVGDLVPVRAMTEGPMQTGEFTNINSQRGENDTEYLGGPAVNVNKGEGPSKNKTKFSESKRMEGFNDPTHAVFGVNVKPILQNKDSWANKENQRTTTNIEQPGIVSLGEGGGNYVLDPNNVPITTTRELMLYGDTNIGVSRPQQGANYIFSNDYIIPTTIRDTTSHDKVLGARGEYNTGATFYSDDARRTIKETTLSYKGGFAAPTEQLPNVMYTDSAKPTIRQTTFIQTPGMNPVPNQTLGIAKDYVNDIAKTTIKETTLSYKGGFAAPTEQLPHVMYTDDAKRTIRQTTSVITPGQNPVPNVTNGYTVDYDDIAKTTIKQTTENNTYEGGLYGVDNYTGYARDNKETAKPTIKQTTLYSTPGMNVGSVDATAGYTRDEMDEARRTQRQTTENTQYEGPMFGVDNYAGYTRDEMDKARTTVKETTLLTDYRGGAATEINQPMSHLAQDNMTICDKRQILTYNRPANGGANVGGPQINKKTARFNCKKPSVYYVTNPGKSLDQSVAPSVTKPYRDNTFKNIKPQLSYGNYHTNQNFINTLKDNPLVNDIYHQKNV